MTETVSKERITQIAEMNGYRDIRELGDHGIVAIMPLAFTHAIITECNEWGYGDRWCYKTYQDAKNALESWDGTGEPTGWHRHPDTGRRYDENGNLYVMP